MNTVSVALIWRGCVMCSCCGICSGCEASGCVCCVARSVFEYCAITVCSRGVLVVSAAKHACLYASYDWVCDRMCVDYYRGVLSCM
jgi:hypothetical protein